MTLSQQALGWTLDRTSDLPKSQRFTWRELVQHRRWISLSGGRSGLGTQRLRRMGYRRVYNLDSYGRAERIVREASPSPGQPW